MDDNAQTGIYEFGLFRLDPRSRSLYKGDRLLPLTAKAFETLVTLLENAGQVVSKSDLMDRVWGETVVEENNLTQQISAIRKVLGEKASDHKFVITVPGRGYSFVAPISQIAPFDPPVSRFRLAGFVRSGSFLGYALAIVYVLLVCIPSFIFTVGPNSPYGKPQTVAVLRFRSAGIGDELLGMGIRDTLRAKLGTLDDVAVRPESSTADSVDIVDAGKQMHADIVLTGSIQRDDERVRVAIEMVDVTRERIVWGATFDENVSNAFELQDSIADAVLTALRAPKLRSSVRLKLQQDA